MRLYVPEGVEYASESAPEDMPEDGLKESWCPIIRPAQYVVVEKLNIHSYNVIIKRTVDRNICLLIREWLYGRQDHSSL